MNDQHWPRLQKKDKTLPFGGTEFKRRIWESDIANIGTRPFEQVILLQASIE
jgi:hypothetical protein